MLDLNDRSTFEWQFRADNHGIGKARCLATMIVYL
jgi:hypothetical protein